MISHSQSYCTLGIIKQIHGKNETGIVLKTTTTICCLNSTYKMIAEREKEKENKENLLQIPFI